MLHLIFGCYVTKAMIVESDIQSIPYAALFYDTGNFSFGFGARDTTGVVGEAITSC